MNIQENPILPRQYFIDWLRIGLIISVFFFHIGMIFRPEKWHINSEESIELLDPIMWWLHLWRMPLLFLVSGVGTYYAFKRKPTWVYIKERFKKLFIPFVFGFFTLVPFMVYIERIDEYKSLMTYMPHMFDGGPYPKGNVSWHHLWFILYLFIISILISPFLKYTPTIQNSNLMLKVIKRLQRTLGLNWLLLILMLSQVILRQYYPYHTHALYNDWSFFTYYLLFFLIGFLFCSNHEIVRHIMEDRRLYLIQTVVSTIVLFSLPLLFNGQSVVRDYTRGITEIIIALSCSITALGYFKRYINGDNKWRGILNEAIYPFYLLHQPIIIAVGYFILKYDLSNGVKAILIVVISMLSFIIIYRLMIKPLKIFRLLFGLKVN